MSLINDALKRANQAARQKNDSSPQAGPSMQPVDHPGHAPQGRSNVVAILLMIVTGLAGLFFVLWWNTRPPGPAVASRLPERPEMVAPAPVSSSPVISADVSADSRRPRIQINTNIVVRELPATLVSSKATEPIPAAIAPATTIPAPTPSTGDVIAAEPPTPPASFPAVKLQGIFFRLKNPEAMVNGKTVRVGESVLGAKVTRIDRREVVVEWNGQSKTLSLDGL